jgi:hypothetical protein
MKYIFTLFLLFWNLSLNLDVVRVSRTVSLKIASGQFSGGGGVLPLFCPPKGGRTTPPPVVTPMDGVSCDKTPRPPCLWGKKFPHAPCTTSLPIIHNFVFLYLFSFLDKVLPSLHTASTFLSQPIYNMEARKFYGTNRQLRTTDTTPTDLDLNIIRDVSLFVVVYDGLVNVV